jgi:DNA-binding response OmpR family regulator
VVEDDQDPVGLPKYNLEQEGFRVNYGTDGSVVLPSIRKYLPDLLILDLMLPGMDGLEVCRQIRQSNKHMALPLLMLTAGSEEAYCVVGLELGADDYVTKPFSLRELIARVRALLRRREIFNLHTRVLQRRDLFIDPESHLVRVNNKAIDLTSSNLDCSTSWRQIPGQCSRANQ